MSTNRIVRILALACVGVAAPALATPYASEVTITGNTVSFDLNEVADSVVAKIGSTTLTLNPAAGFQTFTIPSSTTPFSIQVNKASADGWLNGAALQVGTDSSLTVFNSPRGVAVNMNPGAYFGRIYVSNSAVAAGTITSSAGTTRDGLTRGIYTLNPDQTDALGQGNTALTGSIPALASGTSSSAPFRISVGPDNNLYIGDAGTQYGGVYRTDPNVTPTSGTQLLYGTPANSPDNADADNHGVIASKPIVTITNGNVSIYGNDNLLGKPNSVNNPTATPQYNAIRRYDLGPSPAAGNLTGPAAPLPQTLIANPTTASDSTLNTFDLTQGLFTSDLAKGPKDGRFYYLENRSGGLQPGLFVVDPTTGATIYDSLVDTRNQSGDSSTPDKLTAVNAVAISPDNKYAAFIDSLTTAGLSTANALVIVPLDATIGGVSGLPDLANMKVITNAWPSATANGRDIAFDAAGNLYAVSSGQAMLRIFSPGGTTSYTTSFNGTDFSFGVTHVLGDTNNDGLIDLTDLNNVLNNFGAAGTAGDENTDGHVDLTDLNDVLNNFGGHEALGLSTVPEPASLSLVGLGTAGILARRRRR